MREGSGTLLSNQVLNKIITDNIKFHGYVGSSDKIESKNLKSLVEKIENYIDFLKDNEDFETKFYDIGDGLSVSVKKNEA